MLTSGDHLLLFQRWHKSSPPLNRCRARLGLHRTWCAGSSSLTQSWARCFRSTWCGGSSSLTRSWTRSWTRCLGLHSTRCSGGNSSLTQSWTRCFRRRLGLQSDRCGSGSSSLTLSWAHRFLRGEGLRSTWCGGSSSSLSRRTRSRRCGTWCGCGLW